MMTKDPSYKQIIVPISSNNIKIFMATSNNYVTNINWSLKNIKSDIAINFIHPDHRGLSLIVVATTRHSGTNDLTTSKALSRAIK